MCQKPQTSGGDNGVFTGFVVSPHKKQLESSHDPILPLSNSGFLQNFYSFPSPILEICILTWFDWEPQLFMCVRRCVRACPVMNCWHLTVSYCFCGSWKFPTWLITDNVEENNNAVVNSRHNVGCTSTINKPEHENYSQCVALIKNNGQKSDDFDRIHLNRWLLCESVMAGVESQQRKSVKSVPKRKCWELSPAPLEKNQGAVRVWWSTDKMK